MAWKAQTSGGVTDSISTTARGRAIAGKSDK